MIRLLQRSSSHYACICSLASAPLPNERSCQPHRSTFLAFSAAVSSRFSYTLLTLLSALCSSITNRLSQLDSLMACLTLELKNAGTLC